jgi:hypothetical protein
MTYGRGSDRMRLQVEVLVGKVSDRAARKVLAAYCDGTGSSSIKAVIEAGTYTAFSAVRVEECTFGVVSVAAVDYLGAVFTLDIAGTGA